MFNGMLSMGVDAKMQDKKKTHSKIKVKKWRTRNNDES